MSPWILILVLTNSDGVATQIESVPVPFSTWEMCNEAGVRARTLPVLTPPGAWERSAWSRIDWVCVPAGPVKTVRDACGGGDAGKGDQ